MSDGYVYYPGCSLRATGVAYEESLLELFRILEAPLTELDDWNCCGATSYMSVSEKDAFALAARNLSLAQQQGGKDLVAPCAACYLVLRKTQKFIAEYPEVRGDVEAALEKGGMPALNGVHVRHPLEVLWTDIGAEALKEKVVRPWRGGKVASYYGCQVVRPYHEVDRAHDPKRMDTILDAVGVETVDWGHAAKCCGGTLTGTLPDAGIPLTEEILRAAKRAGAEAIVTICPLCQFNLDMYQKKIRKDTGVDYDMPVLYLPQVLAWTLGGEPKRLGLHRAVAGRDKLDAWTREVTVHA